MPARRGVAVRVERSWKIALQILALLVLLSTVAGRVTFVSALKPGTTVIVSLLCAASLLEGLEWHQSGRFREPGCGRLERSLTYRALSLPLLTITVLVLPSGELSDILIASACCILGASRLALCVLRGNETQRAAKQAQRRDRNRVQLEHEGILAPSSGRGRVASPKRSTPLEILVSQFIGALLLLLAGLAIATVVEGATTGRWEETPHAADGKSGKVHAHMNKGAKGDSRGHRQQPAADEGNAAPSTSSTPPSPTTPSKPVRPCQPLEPAPNVSAATAREIEHLLTLAGSGGAIGCGFTVNVTATSQGPIFWSTTSVSRSSSAPATAIAVIAPGQRRFVALSPAVPAIEQLIRDRRPIGSEREFARYYAGDGSGGDGYFYVILSETGSTLLTKQDLTSRAPLVVSPPPVASAIRSSDKQFGLWLWPSPPVPIGPHDVLYTLKASERGAVIERIRYDVFRHTAWRGTSRHPIRYVPRQHNLVLWELRNWIPTRSASDVRLEEEIERDEG